MSHAKHIWRTTLRVCGALVLIACSVPMLGQHSSLADNTNSGGVVPPQVRFSGTMTDLNGKPMTGVVGVTFALYKDQQGGAPLWLETQSVYPDKTGHYTVLLGSTNSKGMPPDLFVAGEARWLGVQVQGQAEQPRVSLSSVPYAMKAGDAQTIGGLPASAFVRAAPPSSGGTTAAPADIASPLAPGTTPVTTAGGTINMVPKFDASADITNSLIFDNGTSVGIGTTAPTSKLDVKGGAAIRGVLSLTAAGVATAAAGKNSQPLLFTASAFNSSTATAVNQKFQWQAEPAGNNTANTSGTMNLLYGTGTNTPSETGLKIASNGLMTFAAGQTFPGTGTITGIATPSGSGLTGGGTNGVLNLSLTNSCATNQTLQWTGGTWACTTPAIGSVTSVALGAPASDFTVSGSPITQSGTLALNWGVTGPTASNVANAIVRRDGTGSFNITSLNSTGTLLANTGNPTAISGTTSSVPGTGVTGTAPAAGGTWGVEAISGSSISLGYPAGLLGTTTSPDSGFGVWGVSSGSSAADMNGGVYGLSYSGNGIGLLGWVTQKNATAAVFRNNGGGGKLISAQNGASSSYEVFSVGNNGAVKAAGPIVGPAGSGIPIAFGTVNSAGTLQSGTSNCTVGWNSSAGRYEITISGVSYYYLSFSTQVTLVSYPGFAATISTDSVGGLLLVMIHDSNGNLRQANFSFAVYQYATPLSSSQKEADQPERTMTPSGLPGR